MRSSVIVVSQSEKHGRSSGTTFVVLLAVASFDFSFIDPASKLSCTEMVSRIVVDDGGTGSFVDSTSEVRNNNLAIVVSSAARPDRFSSGPSSKMANDIPSGGILLVSQSEKQGRSSGTTLTRSVRADE